MGEKKIAAESRISGSEGVITAVARNVGSALGAIAAKTHDLISTTKVAKRVAKRAKAARPKATGREKSLKKSPNTGTRKAVASKKAKPQRKRPRPA